MRWGAMLAMFLWTVCGGALAGETSPLFGATDDPPFQVAINPATGQPLVLSPPVEPVAQVAR